MFDVTQRARIYDLVNTHEECAQDFLFIDTFTALISLFNTVLDQ